MAALERLLEVLREDVDRTLAFLGRNVIDPKQAVNPPPLSGTDVWRPYRMSSGA